MFKEYVSKIADGIVKGQIPNSYHLLFLLDITCEYFYEYDYDCYEILYPALLFLKKSLEIEEKEGGE